MKRFFLAAGVALALGVVAVVAHHLWNYCVLDEDWRLGAMT